MVSNSQTTFGITFKSRVTLAYFAWHPKMFKISLHTGMYTQPMLPGVFYAVEAGFQPHKPWKQYPDSCESENVASPRGLCTPPERQAPPPRDGHPLGCITYGRNDPLAPLHKIYRMKMPPPFQRTTHWPEYYLSQHIRLYMFRLDYTWRAHKHLGIRDRTLSRLASMQWLVSLGLLAWYMCQGILIYINMITFTNFESTRRLSCLSTSDRQDLYIRSHQHVPT